MRWPVKKMTKAGAMLRAAGSAFTLLEILVAIGAVAIISVGMAAIFQAVGRTVTGAQRVSTMTQYAALIERQLRTDFLNITREGFLVIRNQVATNNAGQILDVPQNADDARPKPRRVDEILFFTKHKAETSREPVNAQFIARGSDSMVWYGHGLLPQHRTGQLRDVQPNWNDVNDPALTGWLGQAGSPNAYASNWSLLRRQTVLAQPVASRQAVPATGWPADLRVFARPQIPASPIMDKDCQIACQPAVSSIFRSVARVTYDGGNQPNRVHVRWDSPSPGETPPHGTPRVSSGMIDVATSDFGEIRSLIQTCDQTPAQIESRDYFSRPGDNPVIGNWSAGNIPAIDRMHAWMRDALPTQSDMSASAPGSANDPKGARMRYEDYPPDFLTTVTASNGGESALSSRRADQMMLAGSKFVPRCTQFAVEWSFAETNAAGEVTWIGSPVFDLQGRFTRFTQYGGNYIPYPGVKTTNGLDFKVERRVVYSPAIPSPSASQTVCFGYVDPSYRPQTNNVAMPPSVPWAWPRMVRVTITIADERDPTVEETFQWQFDLPRPPTI